MARDSLDRIAVLIERETLGSEGYTLVELLASSAGETFTVVGGGMEVQNLMVETVAW